MLSGFAAPLSLSSSVNLLVSLVPPMQSPRRSPRTKSTPVQATALPPTRRRVLFVCLGNICRSPAAEAVFKGEVARRGLADEFLIESCGTGGGHRRWLEDGWGYHQGDGPDERMIEAGARRGLQVAGASRVLVQEDFDKFGMIVGMDRSNLEMINKAKNFWGLKDVGSEVRLMSEFSSDSGFKGRAVPDPYYGGPSGFDRVLDLLQDCCAGLAEHLLADQETAAQGTRP